MNMQLFIKLWMSVCLRELKALTALFTYRSEVPACDADTVLAAKLQ